MSLKIHVFYTRFLKGFISAGLTAVVLQLQQGTTISSFEDIKKFGFSLALAFFTGVVLALEKLNRWEE